ncbi:hypothetical protein N2601_10210 [Rhizobium sp. CB3060]|uniref:hypothetical protein n=1 Tax=unclassified Rhizobium TaxID=2613769 RepID=UPI0021A547C9|nr:MULTISPECIES: hypothetical protein [Rhizobium]MDK4738701.1 hypothetical protein [Rhizobium sp. CNPSo 3464]UWU19687.1 hypothetical protein N2601_10210 [Rhizobium tropici]
MSFAAEELTSDLGFFTAVLGCAREMVAAYADNPRASSIFASQQRWLMAQAGLGLYYGGIDGEQPGLYARRFVDYVLKHEIASHNTALSFIQEMLTYRFLRYLADPPIKRLRPIEPTEAAVEHLSKWIYIHLMVLDSLDGGRRIATFVERPEIIAALQPAIAARIIANDRVRHPGETFDLFTWANSGGVVMDYLMSRIATIDPTAARMVIGPISFTEICDRFLISRTHVKRLMSKASSMGSVGWTGSPGKSHFWLSRGFIQEYWDYQTEKFAIIGAVWEEAFGAQPEPAPTEPPILTSAAL